MTDTVTTEVHSDAAADANLELAESLREVATWLEMHAGDLPEMRATGWISEFRKRDARAELTALATALGERATETRRDDKVMVAGNFGPVMLFAYAEIRELVDEPPLVSYPPILKPSGGVFTDDELDRAVEPHVDNQGYEVTS